MQTYKPGTEAQLTHNGQRQFYPVIRFAFPNIQDNYYLNEPQPTRAKARRVAANHIKNLLNTAA